MALPIFNYPNINRVVLNRGYLKEEINQYRAEMEAIGKPFLLDDDDERSEEYAHFFFIGKHEGKEVIYDAVLYTLRMQHESEMFEIAEHRAAKQFPEYKKINYEEDENGNLEPLDDLDEEIGLFMAEVIMELEEEGAVKVKEHIDKDIHVDFGIALDIGLHVEEISDTVIEKFIEEYNKGTLQLDETLYTFQMKESVGE
ncbi:MAG: hypothetical protein O9340_14320 [Cyclobacteriaceae bacterium]|nr:hypothetical protein [Cyclobacteriaceae bacterium]